MSSTTINYYFTPSLTEVRNESFSYNLGPAVVSAGFGSDFVWATTDTGDDYINAGAGRDWVRAEAGNDTIWGDSRVAISDAEFPDSSIFDGDVLVGGNGSDDIYGQLGDDYINGEAGNDEIYGGANHDFLQGGRDTDFIYGGAGDDTLVSGAVADVPDAYTFTINIDFNGINDTALDQSLTTQLGSMSIDLSNFLDQLSGGRGNDTYILDSSFDTIFDYAGEGTDRAFTPVTYTLGANASVEYFFTTSNTGSTIIHLTGNGTGQTIEGNVSAQTLSGNGGNDFLTGYSGRDTLWGGLQNDRFIFLELADSGSAVATADRVMDFTDSGGEQDQIDIRGIDADTAVANDQAFVLDTNGSFSTGEIRQTLINGGTDLLLEFNSDADATSEMAIVLVGRASLLNGADFLP